MVNSRQKIVGATQWVAPTNFLLLAAAVIYRHLSRIGWEKVGD